jgi:hypothetical protein
MQDPEKFLIARLRVPPICICLRSAIVRTASTPSRKDRAMFVRLYAGKFRPAPDSRVVILTRLSHAGFGKAKVKARGKAKN